MTPARTPPTADRARLGLVTDCSRCAGLCCTALPFERSASFALDKAAGRPCPNLDAAFRCGIHTTLRADGFTGCDVFDCLGAGNHTVQIVSDGRTWRSHPEHAEVQFAAFEFVRALHELLWFTTEAQSWGAVTRTAVADRLQRGQDDLVALRTRVDDGVPAPVTLDEELNRIQASLRDALLEASVLERTARGAVGPDHARADLVGADRRGVRWRGAVLRGAVLLGADLRGADLRDAELLGTDLRDTDLRGADLRGTLYLTPVQLQAARGDAATRLDPDVPRPAHWP